MMHSFKIILPGSIRSKKNSKRIFARGKFKTVLPSKSYCEWEKQARDAVKLQDYQIMEGPISVEAHIYYKGPQPDLSGCLESIGDCLENIIWDNDRQIISWDGSRLHHEINNPRTEVIVKWRESGDSDWL